MTLMKNLGSIAGPPMLGDWLGTWTSSLGPGQPLHLSCELAVARADAGRT